ncbi:MAG: hypothetical protein IJC93_04690 [Clostridia bacterium]|nr:hypothetical protein [Clostridia bacterium]
MARKLGVAYQSSVAPLGDGSVFMVADNGADYIIAPPELGFCGETVRLARHEYTKAPLTHEAAVLLRKLFPFCAPQRVLTREKTIGLGDRLGIAGTAHCRLLQSHPDFTPVLAQQSMRELDLTGRTYDDVLDAATFAVFRAGYRGGFGADGDHLKTIADIQDALQKGYTMITLDLSDHIEKSAVTLPCAELELPADEQDALYADRTFAVEDIEIAISREDYLRARRIYGKALDFATEVWQTCFAGSDTADLEISVDETDTETTPAQLWYVASELTRRGVRFATIAPRFTGEFQKGIDYIGDIAAFTKDIYADAAIARHFGCKLSVHSGSDKFSVFPIVAEATKGQFHLKTAGTNWLCAMQVIAEADPALYREVHAFALENFAEACKYYKVTTDLAKVPALDTLSDAELPDLFTQNDSRQLIHITYGLILEARNADGSYRFRDRLYACWSENAQVYADALDTHIGRHLTLLGSKAV